MKNMLNTRTLVRNLVISYSICYTKLSLTATETSSTAGTTSASATTKSTAAAATRISTSRPGVLMLVAAKPTAAPTTTATITLRDCDCSLLFVGRKVDPQRGTLDSKAVKPLLHGHGSVDRGKAHEGVAGLGSPLLEFRNARSDEVNFLQRTIGVLHAVDKGSDVVALELGRNATEE